MVEGEIQLLQITPPHTHTQLIKQCKTTFLIKKKFLSSLTMASSTSQGQAHLPPSPTPSLHTSSLLYPMTLPSHAHPQDQDCALPPPRIPRAQSA